MSCKKEARSSRNKAKDLNARQKANMPAKAGRRKTYTSGKRKVKNFHPSNGYTVPSKFSSDKTMQESIAIGAMSRRQCAARDKRIREQLGKIAEIEKHERAGVSDPFIFSRMRAHAKAGILEL